MNVSVWKRAGVAAAAVAVVTGVAGCQDGDGKAAGADKAQTQSLGDITKVIRTAYEKTSAAKSAKIRMTMELPTGLEGGGTMEMTGVQGWDPTVMDITVKGSMLGAAGAGGADSMRMITLGDVMYMDMGAKQAAEMDGKRWLKLDMQAASEASGDKVLSKTMAGGLENMNQDPAKQLALLLDSPNLKHLGAEKVDGVEAQHYKGTLTLEQMVAANKSLDVLSEKDRAELVEGVKKAGITAYDTEVWVREDGYPARMDLGMKSAQGTVKMGMHFSDYGAKATVQAPPAEETVDFFEMLKGLGAEGGQA
ncbi:hypothetical protein [Streptomyces sp. SJL17-1]|uniref:hypothetical protein n=1 Tax=Streptomyces sp. SJL17-1 TaxID=2967223 RepID=UPI002967648C|nr:hypothetical protein [Streptomyces sp. SJL17-1]